MEATKIGLMKLITLIPFIFFAGYSFFILRELVFGFVFLGYEVIYYFLLIRKKLHYNTPEEKTLKDAGRIALGWAFILLFSSLLFRDVAYSPILWGLAWAPIGILLVWARLAGLWEILLQSRL